MTVAPDPRTTPSPGGGADAGPAERWRPSLRLVLIGLVLCGLVPMSLFSGLLIRAVWQLQQEEVRQGLLETAEALLLAVEGEVVADLRQLELLAASPLLDLADLTAFRRRAADVVASGRWTNMMVSGRDGRESMALDRAAGEERERPLDEELFRRVVATGRPAIAGRLVDSSDGHETLLVAVPVVRDGRLVAVLAAALDLAAFDKIVSERVVRDDGIGSVLDRDLRFIARSRRPEDYRGNPVIPPMREVIPGAPQGVRRSPVYDGPSVYGAWTTGERTGWTVTLGVPAEPIDAALRRSLLGMAGAGLLIVVLTGALALRQARRLGGSIHDIGEATRALARLEPLPPLHRTVREHDAVAAALAATSDRLREQARENEELLARETELRRVAEESNRAKDEFVAMLAHELRNPLAAIASAGAVLQALPADAAGSERARAIVVRQSAHLARLVDDLLDAGRLTTGKIRIVESELDLAALLRHVVAGIWEEPARHDVHLDLEPAWVAGDAARLEQVFVNLLGNARKFTPAGGRIDVVLRVVDGTAVVEVRDSGAGISAVLLPRVFDLFVQGEQRLDRAAGGLGIGLSLTRQLVELHGGTVEVASDGPERGSTFTVRLPALPTPAVAAVDAPAADAGTTAHPRTVLLVEDGEDARDALGALLAERGHTVEMAGDGETALERFAAWRPDVVLLDIGLPGIDGFEVARRLRAAATHPFRLVALTGYGTAADRRRAAAAGFDDHLVKPVDLAALWQAIERPLGAAGEA